MLLIQEISRVNNDSQILIHNHTHEIIVAFGHHVFEIVKLLLKSIPALQHLQLDIHIFLTILKSTKIALSLILQWLPKHKSCNKTKIIFKMFKNCIYSVYGCWGLSNISLTWKKGYSSLSINNSLKHKIFVFLNLS